MQEYSRRLDRKRKLVILVWHTGSFVALLVALLVLIRVSPSFWEYYNQSSDESSQSRVVTDFIAALSVLILVLSVWVAGFTVYNAIHHYHGNTKRGMRVATVEHLRTALRNFRIDERAVFEVLCKVSGSTSKHRKYGMTADDLRELRHLFDGFDCSLSATDAIGFNEEQAQAMEKHYYFRSRIRLMLDGLDQLGAAVARKCFGFVIIDSVAGPQIVDIYLRWYPFIDCRRRAPRREHAFRQLEWLAHCIVAYRVIQISDRVKLAVDCGEVAYATSVAERAWVALAMPGGAEDSIHYLRNNPNPAFRNRHDTHLGYLLTRRVFSNRTLAEVSELRNLVMSAKKGPNTP